jgi:hypothetical protein
MKNVFYVIFIILITQNLFADDTYVKIIGGAAKMMSEHPSVQMKGEDVKIILHKEDYAVDATFYFYNEGVSTMVLVGFPMERRNDGVIWCVSGGYD